MNFLPPALTGGRDHPPDAAVTALVPHWGMENLREALTDQSILHRCAERLQHRYGVPTETGVMMACAAVTAAAGPLFAVIAPHGTVVHPSLHLLLVSTTPCPFQFAALEVFNLLTTRSRRSVEEYGTTGEMTAAEIHRLAEECLREAKGIEGTLADQHAHMVRQHGKDFETRYPGAFISYWAEVKQLRQKVAEKMAEARRLMGTAGYVRRPGTVVEAMSPAGWLSPGDYSSDGAMFNLDLEGTTWGMLLGERPPLRLKVAHRLVAGLTGAPFRHGGITSPAWHLSSLSVLHPVAFARLRGGRDHGGFGIDPDAAALGNPG